MVNVNVVCRVDMSSYSGDLSNGVYLNGSFNSWCGTCTSMTRDGTSDVWTITVDNLDVNTSVLGNPTTSIGPNEHEWVFTVNG